MTYEENNLMFEQLFNYCQVLKNFMSKYLLPSSSNKKNHEIQITMQQNSFVLIVNYLHIQKIHALVLLILYISLQHDYKTMHC